MCLAGNLVVIQPVSLQNPHQGRKDVPWGVDHLQQGSKVLSIVRKSYPGTPSWHWHIKESGWERISRSLEKSEVMVE